MRGSSLISVADGTSVPPVAHRSDVVARLCAEASTLREMGLARCALFGSFARDQMIRPDSDVDLLVSFQPGRKDFDAYLALVDHLETILARRVDMVTIESVSRHLVDAVLEQAKPIDLRPARSFSHHHHSGASLPC